MLPRRNSISTSHQSFISLRWQAERVQICLSAFCSGNDSVEMSPKRGIDALLALFLLSLTHHLRMGSSACSKARLAEVPAGKPQQGGMAANSQPTFPDSMCTTNPPDPTGSWKHPAYKPSPWLPCARTVVACKAHRVHEIVRQNACSPFLKSVGDSKGH